VTERAQKRFTFWGSVIAAVATAATIGAALVRPVAAGEVRPTAEKVEQIGNRMTAAETRQGDLDRRLERMESKLDRLLERSAGK
jgi:TolA-binding protein